MADSSNSTNLDYTDILLKNNKKCYDWYIKMDELKKAKIIEETYNMVNKIGNFNNSNSYTLGFTQECEIEKYLADKQYKFTNSSKEAKSGDFIVTHNNVDIIIESKNYTSTVSYTEVEKLLRDMERLNINNAVFVSNTNISRIKDRIQFVEISGKYIYFINTEGQPIDIFYNIMDMCIQSLSALKHNFHIINESIPKLIKRLSTNMGMLYDFKELLTDAKYTCLRKFDTLEKSINQYESKIRDNIHELADVIEPKTGSKEDMKTIINSISDAAMKNFLSELVDNYEGELSENNNSIFFGNKQIELRKRKPLFKFKIEDDTKIEVQSTWEVKNRIVVVPLNVENRQFIRNIILK